MLGVFEILGGVVLIAALAIIAVKMGAIDLSGAISGGVISFVAYLAGGLAWLVIIVLFFGISSSLTRYRYDYKNKIGSAQEKKGRRSWPNSIANAGVALAASLGELYFHSDVFAIAFLASIATATADTVATEIGVLSSATPRLITNLRSRVRAGTSGGVTCLGESAALLASISIGVAGLLLYMFSPGSNMVARVLISVVPGAMIGTSFDSFLGATVQSLYKCQVCGEMTENLHHHGTRTTRFKGYQLVDNNVVNIAGIFVGAVSAVLIYIALGLP